MSAGLLQVYTGMIFFTVNYAAAGKEVLCAPARQESERAPAALPAGSGCRQQGFASA
jgi:hypothetical protein